MKKKSIKKNAILNGIRNVLNLLFPLITFPYVSKVLSVHKLGEYNFANSVVNYFVLIAGLGISTYAIREGTKYRNKRNEFSDFASMMFTINIYSTILSYILLILCIIFYSKLERYMVLLIIFSLQIIFTTIGVEWVYSIYEEYTYITVRGIIFKIISIVLMFIFVKKPSDVAIYAAITVFSTVGSNILNYIKLKDYCSLKFISIKKCLSHLKPILIIFASNIAIMIYVYSDTTMLGIMDGTYSVGIYSVSVKIYTIIKNLLASILLVTIPRASLYYGKQMKQEFNNLVQKVYDNLSVILFPAVVGIFCVSDKLILFISDKNYLRATSSLRILSIALIFSIIGWIFSQCVLVPAQKEKIVLIATCVSAVVNIAMNYILIPGWKENATAFTTLLSELIMLCVCGYYGMKVCKIRIINRNIISVFVGCAGVGSICKIMNYILKLIKLNDIISLVLTILAAGIIYVIILLILKNKVIFTILNEITRKIKNKK